MSFTVRPVIVLVVDASGRPAALWSNLGHEPTAGELAELRIRRGSVRGADLALTPALRTAAAEALGTADWSRRGRIWVT